MKSKTTTAMEWIRANTAGHTQQLLIPIIERARKEGGETAASRIRDDAQADAIKKFRPEIERLERAVNIYKFIVDCHEATIRRTQEQRDGALLLNDFLRNQVSETGKKLDEAKEIIELASHGYNTNYQKVPDCLCSRCTFPARVNKFLEAA